MKQASNTQVSKFSKDPPLMTVEYTRIVSQLFSDFLFDSTEQSSKPPVCGMHGKRPGRSFVVLEKGERVHLWYVVFCSVREFGVKDEVEGKAINLLANLNFNFSPKLGGCNRKTTL